MADENATVHVDIRVEAAAEDTTYHIVAWLNWWRVLNARNAVMAVCETRDEAEAWIAGQPA